MNKFLTIAIIICAAAIAASVWLPGYLSKGGTEDGAGMGPSDGPVVIDGRGEVLSYIQGDRSGKAGESMRDFAAKGIVSGRVTERPSEPRVSPEEAKKIAAAQQAAQHLSIGISKLESLCVPAGTGKEAKTKLATDIVKNSGMYISNCNINGSKHRRIPEDPSKTVTLGAYPQNGQEPEPIEWLVVAVSGRDLYVVSKYVLERRAFEETDRNAAWKDCSLRK